jgi:myo-inositol 2-dehydrogenase / D-chiro-inositol 1-dehydrogenase
MVESNIVKIGIIGAGKISEKHILAYKALGYNDITIFDLDTYHSDKVASSFNIKEAASFTVLLEESDIIDICTPVKTHRELIIQSLKAHNHVFCEKPLCQTVEEASEIREAATKADKLLMVGHLYRFHPCFQQVKRWIDTRIIGSIHSGIFRIGGRGNHKKWKHMKKEGGGCINEMLIHKLDLIRFFFDKIDGIKLLNKETIIKERTIEGEGFIADAEDNVVLKVNVGNSRIICQADFTSPSYMEYIELHGERGSIFTSILDFLPTVLFLSKPYGIYNQGNNIISHKQSNLFELELQHFLNCIENGQNNVNSVDDSVELMRILDKIR